LYEAIYLLQVKLLIQIIIFLAIVKTHGIKLDQVEEVQEVKED
jgi:hypothetical protein